MSTFDDLAFTELSLFLGRPVGPTERVGGAYNSPPHIMDGAVKAKKAGSKNFDAVLATAMETGDIAPVNSWVLNLTTRCSVSKASPFAANAANLYNMFFAKAGRLKSDRAIAWYIIEYRSTYPGRGFPLISDPELISLAQGQAAAPVALKDVPSSSGPKISEGGSISGSSQGSGLSGLSGVSTVQVERVFTHLEGLSDQMKAVQLRMVDMEKKVKPAEGNGRGTRPPGSCFVCWSLDHGIGACPKLPKHLREACKKASAGETE